MKVTISISKAGSTLDLWVQDWGDRGRPQNRVLGRIWSQLKQRVGECRGGVDGWMGKCVGLQLGWWMRRTRMIYSKSQGWGQRPCDSH